MCRRLRMAGRSQAVWALAVGFLGAIGCGKSVGPVAPVSGTVTMDGKPLPDASVAFFPDASHGNKTSVMSRGQSGPDGVYHLATESSTGAHAEGTPPGWYKVVVDTRNMSNPDDDKHINVNKKFTSPDTTTLSVEVVSSPSPGKYDLVVTK